MISDELGMQLHDRSTLGEVLSDLEKAQLETWYEQKDLAEAKLLGTPLDLTSTQPERRAQLRSQIQESLAQVQEVTRLIGQVTAENETLRQEIGVLQQRLTATKSA